MISRRVDLAVVVAVGAASIDEHHTILSSQLLILNFRTATPGFRKETVVDIVKCWVIRR